MPLIYLSTDEVNQTLARAWGEQRGVKVECPRPSDRSWEERCDAVLLDLDHATSEWIGGLATLLETARTMCPVAVHGYSAARDAFRHAYRDRGVDVHSRLGPELLRKLIRAAITPAPRPAEEDSDSLTWVNLA